MSAIKADAYFAKNAARAGTCQQTPVVEARKVAAGENIIITSFMSVMSRASEEGWQIRIGSRYNFVNNADFEQCFKRVEIAATKDLPAGAKVVPVKKGAEIYTQPWSDTEMGVVGKADADGFLVTLPEDNKQRFMSESSFNATFKSAATPAPRADQGFFQYQTQADDKPTRYMVLEKPVTFAFKQGDYEAAAGSVLWENENDEDGFTIETAESFAQNFTVVKPQRPALTIVPREPQ